MQHLYSNLRRHLAFFALIAAAGITLALPPTAEAASYAAERSITSPAPTTLRQLESSTYRIGFKNTGTTTWTSTGTNRLTVKTTEAIKNEHWFASRSWIDRLTVTTMTPDTVRPGEIAYFNLGLEAPRRAARFVAYFAVFAGTQKVPGTEFTLPITVTNEVYNGNVSAPVAIPAAATTASAPAGLKRVSFLTGLPMLRSAQSLSLDAGGTTDFTIGFKNTGDRNWRNTSPSLITIAFNDQSTPGVSFRAPSWTSGTTAATQPTAMVKPGEIGFFTFTIQAPTTAGQYNPEFYLVMNDDTLVEGTSFRLPIGVATDAPTVPPSTLAGSGGTSSPRIVCIAAEDQDPGDPASTGLCQPKHEEPALRVGIDKLAGQLGVKANGPYLIEDNAGRAYVQVLPELTTFLSYSPTEGVYTAVGPGPIIRSPLPLRIRTVNEPSIVTLTTFVNPVAYNSGWNDNSYRGTIEIRWSENDEKVWIINELKMEDYLKGLAESSNAAQPEYQKALVTAARSYALYHHETGTKHKKRHFDVVATVSDQYYRGYESEKRLPNVSVAVAATRGQVVTYQGSVVVTPYSASTNGTTRAWEDVWGGTPKPWLIRKPVPKDVGRQRFGHAVGLSQLAANDMAKDGMNYVDILKFFYVNTEIAQWYN